METKFVVFEIGSSQYALSSKDALTFANNHLWFEDYEKDEYFKLTPKHSHATLFESKTKAKIAIGLLPTGIYRIDEVYEVDEMKIREDEESFELENSIKDTLYRLENYSKIQNGEGNNWVSYFRYDKKYEKFIEGYYTNEYWSFNGMVSGKYYRAICNEKGFTEISFSEIERHVRNHTLETEYKWLISKMR